MFMQLLNVTYGAIEVGVIWGVMALGVFLTYRILDYADLTVDGSLTMGGAVAATVISNGGNAFFGLLLALAAGMLAGGATAFLHTKLKIPSLLAGILTQQGLYSINLHIMGGWQGKANVSLLHMPTMFTQLEELTGWDVTFATLVMGIVLLTVIILVLWWFLNTEKGFALRATGINQRMIRAQGVNTDNMIILGLMLSNGIVAMGGALIAQMQGFSDVSSGTGAIVIGLAAVIIGEVLFGKKTLARNMIAVVLGSVVYRIFIALVLLRGLPPVDLKLFTAILVAIALSLPLFKEIFLTIQKNYRLRKAVQQSQRSGEDGEKRA